MGKKYIKIPEVLSSWLIRFQVFSARAKKKIQIKSQKASNRLKICEHAFHTKPQTITKFDT